ncbi:MAG: hypothetical protein K6C36_05300 [Clostridia bacterium]|nr:hypothetical protein [Clostridia bacterium]
MFWTEEKDGTLTHAGTTAAEEAGWLEKRFMLTKVDKLVIMPNHVHMIITLIGAMPDTCEKTPDIKNIVGAFKASVTRKAGNGKTIWQKSFYDRVLRNDKEYSDAWDYIDANPYKYFNKAKYREYPW